MHVRQGVYRDGQEDGGTWIERQMEGDEAREAWGERAVATEPSRGSDLGMALVLISTGGHERYTDRQTDRQTDR